MRQVKNGWKACGRYGNQVNNHAWFDATLVYRFNECNRGG